MDGHADSLLYGKKGRGKLSLSPPAFISFSFKFYSSTSWFTGGENLNVKILYHLIKSRIGCIFPNESNSTSWRFTSHASASAWRARQRRAEPVARGPLLTAGVRHAYSPTVYLLERGRRERRVAEDGGGGARVVGDVSLNWANGPKPVPGFRSGRTTVECHAVAAAPALTNLLLALPPIRFRALQFSLPFPSRFIHSIPLIFQTLKFRLILLLNGVEIRWQNMKES